MSSALFRNNATVTAVQRTQGQDRYGRDQRGVVSGLTAFRIHLDRSTRRVTGVNGVTTTVDGTALVAKRFDLQEGDLLEISDGSSWVVFNVDEALDVVNARPVHRLYGLTKRRKNS